MDNISNSKTPYISVKEGIKGLRKYGITEKDYTLFQKVTDVEGYKKIGLAKFISLLGDIATGYKSTSDVEATKAANQLINKFTSNGINYFVRLSTKEFGYNDIIAELGNSPKPLEATEKVTNFEDLIKIPITDILTEFSEADLKEANDIMKHCKGQ